MASVWRRRDNRELTLKDRTLRELERIAFADIRDVVTWASTPEFSDASEIVGAVDTISVTLSDRLTPDAAAAIMNVFHKSGQVRVEMHDKQAALVSLAKHLGLFQDRPAAPSATVNQLNLGLVQAEEAARLLRPVRPHPLAGPPASLRPSLRDRGQPDLARVRSRFASKASVN